MLSRLALEVARAKSVDDMIRVVVEVATPLLGASNATASLVDESGSTLTIYHGAAATTGDVRVVEVADPTPAGDVVRTGRAVYLESTYALVTRYPSMAARVPASVWGALAVVPMNAGGELIGALMVRYPGPVAFTPEDKELLSSTSELLGEALARAMGHDRLAAHTRRLIESNRDLDNFAAAVAHDLRQPIRHIGSYIHLLLEKVGAHALDSEATHYADTISSALGRADRMIVALLEYSRVTGKPLLDAEVALDRLVDDVVEILQPKLTEAAATVRSEGLPVVRGDADLLRQIVQNLVENAVKYRDPSRPAEIALSAQREDEGNDLAPMWRVSVRDNGIGIRAEHLEAVFEVFSRARPRDEPGGTGIGLALAKRIVERHGGTIGVQSQTGLGTTFWFTLPGAVVRHRY
jgi:signal transduction histidine kinase